jgi:hypothetical protein
LFHRFAEGVRAAKSARAAAFFISDWLREKIPMPPACVRDESHDELMQAVATLHAELGRLESLAYELQDRVCARPSFLGHRKGAKMTREEYFFALAHGVEKRHLRGKKPPDEPPVSPTANP